MGNDTAIVTLKEKIDGLNQLAWEVRINDSPKALQLSQESVKLARSIDYTKGLAEGLRSLGFANVRLYKNEEAAPLLRESLALFQSINDIKGQAVDYEYLGIIERNRGNLGMSLELLLKGYVLIQQVGSVEIETTTCYQIGVTYKHLGNHENALDYLYKALSIAKSSGNILMVAYATNIIGSIYFDNGGHKHALDCYQQGLVIRRESNDKWGEAGSLDNIGFTYLKLKDLDKAIDYCKQSLTITQSTGDKKGEANALLHLAEIYEEAGDIKQASKFSNESLEIRKARGDRRGEAEALLFLADLHQNEKDTEDDQVFEWLSGALSIAEEIKAQDLLSSAYYNLHEYYTRKRNFKESLTHLEAHLKIEKELHKNTIIQKVSNLEISHKAETIGRRNKELTELNEKIEKANEELKIEAALEKVRVVAMAMRKGDDLMLISEVIYKQLLILGFSNVRNVQIAIDDDEKQLYNGVEYSEYYQNRLVEVPYDSSPMFREIVNELKRSDNAFYQKEITGKDFEDWRNWRMNIDTKNHPDIASATSMCFYLHSVGAGMLGISTFNAITNDQLEILKRLRNVFELSYKRYIDIEKAEAQAREAEIELALERVRARTMAMHKSDELKEVIRVVYEQFLHLNIHVEHAGFIIDYKDRDDLHIWLADQHLVPSEVTIPCFDSPPNNSIKEAKEKGRDFFKYLLAFEEKNKFYRDLFKIIPDVPEETLKYYFNCPGLAGSGVLLENVGLYIENFSGIPYTNDENATLMRFGKVFQQTYTRFLDLQKAEEQAREARIEAALENIRSRSLAMHRSDEVKEVVKKVFEKMKELGFFQNNSVMIVLPKNEFRDAVHWTFNENFETTEYYIPAFDHPVSTEALKAWKNGENTFEIQLDKQGKDKFLDLIFSETDYSKVPDNFKQYLYSTEAYSQFFAFEQHCGLLVDTFTSFVYSQNQKDIVIRFAKVFEQAYIRFLDLQKAEAQAREAEIELALERVRARAMAMQKPTEFVEVVNVMGEQFINLDFDIEWANFGANGFDVSEGIDTWNFAVIPGGDPISSRLFIPYFEHPLFTDAKKQLDEYRRTGSDFFEMTYDKDVKDQWLDHLFAKTFFKDVPEEYQAIQYAKPGYTTSNLILKDTWLSIGKFDTRSFTDEQHSILKRFGKAFGQAYTRFLDLQKAEAQAREAKIEGALEKVRSRTMGMQKSDELQSAALLLFQQVQALGAKYFACGFNIWDEDKKAATAWMAREDAILPPFKTSSSEDVFLEILEAAKQGETLFVREQGGEELEIHYRYMASIPLFKVMMEEMKKAGLSVPTFQIIHCAFFAQGYLMFISFEPVPEAHDIFKRFAKVFEQTYTRFLDLQKAEAQAREAEIELALERVRARTMAMQKSEELQEVVHTVFERLKELNIDFYTAIIILFEQGSKDIVWWLESKAYHQYQKVIVPYAEFPYLHDLFSARENKIDFFSKTYSLEEKNKLFHHLFANTNLKYVPQQQQEFLLGTGFATMSVSLSKNIGLHITSYSRRSFSEQDNDIFKRFAKVFDQAYTRFLDLQKAEAQAREALIEAALERVRARALAMQEPEELKEVAQVLRTEMGLLGIEELETCSIYIHEQDSETAECWYALKDPKDTQKKMVADHFHLELNDTWVGREMKKFYSSGEKQTSVVMQGANRKEWIAYCYKHSPAFSGFYGDTIPDRTYHLYKFSHGYIGAAAPADISAESWRLLSRAASVFSLAYSRFRDLTQARSDLIKLKEEKKRAEDALTELQATQKQLIQAEKMASLGELTAGIAHEIQNPLNFVNNFSDVSNELLEEMKQELATGNTQQAIEIVNDVKENLEKILHHGKRADSIVKGMLQHSRSTSGQKEPTDINTLAEEYLRLSYHGLRAKDKFFHAKFETDLDPALNKINIVPQEIGRVILNLVNNSFYAVNEKKKNKGNGYEPIVTISTKAVKSPLGGLGVVEIKVKDNGNGIPQKDLDKIFQPFFTTKPTGQGTGLGLSLSYDIITKGHDGEIKVKTKEGEGSEFTISLPMN